MIRAACIISFLLVAAMRVSRTASTIQWIPPNAPERLIRHGESSVVVQAEHPHYFSVITVKDQEPHTTSEQSNVIGYSYKNINHIRVQMSTGPSHPVALQLSSDAVIKMRRLDIPQTASLRETESSEVSSDEQSLSDPPTMKIANRVLVEVKKDSLISLTVDDDELTSTGRDGLVEISRNEAGAMAVLSSPGIFKE